MKNYVQEATNTRLNWEQKLGIRLLAVVHDINKLSSDFLAAKSVNHPKKDRHAEQIREIMSPFAEFWTSTGNIPFFRLGLTSAAPLWYLAMKHHDRTEDVFLRQFQKSEVYSTSISANAIPYGRKQLDTVISLNNAVLTGEKLEHIRYVIMNRLPSFYNISSQEEARRKYFDMDNILRILECVPADTRELSISYAEHVENIEAYFSEIVPPLQPAVMQTWRTLLTSSGLTFNRLAMEFTDFFASLCYIYEDFLLHYEKKIEKHCQNVHSQQCIARLSYIEEERSLLKTIGPKKVYSNDQMFTFFHNFYQQEKPKSLYSVAADLLGIYGTHRNIPDTLVQSAFLLKTSVSTIEGPFKKLSVGNVMEVSIGDQTATLPKRLLMLSSAVTFQKHSSIDLPYEKVFLTPLPLLKKNDYVVLDLPKKLWLRNQNCEGKEPRSV
jgi:hypothetical protein